MSNLDSSLRLEDVAQAAGFSPFHFHRVFRAILGETLQQFVKRQRLERALYWMSHTPSRSLTEIALECGFSSSSDFSRSFKQRFEVAPSAFDLEQFREERRADLEQVMANQEDRDCFGKFDSLREVDEMSSHRSVRKPINDNHI